MFTWEGSIDSSSNDGFPYLLDTFNKPPVGNEQEESWDFPGGSVVMIPCFKCRGHGFDP